MFGTSSLQEFLIIVMIITMLSLTGLWPRVLRGLRELRGEHFDEEEMSGTSPQDLDICYRLLGLSSSASWDEVEKAYRRKAKIHHPDHGGDEDTMRTLNEAYNYIKRVRAPK